ncbi:SAM-dependent methyltransferase [Polychaeton citri CBS 116435]|uniref:SAM-dependent methyltransferase n=1 Tax=Polychaeton citri CBS 116435 TaxID=1314669 RepID=A0A9P4UN54_9PEZI|nr:SAM-dependent methyltransferase [Polychaeton citri CBS 116435]
MSALAEANRQAWNDMAAQYNSKPWQLRISQQVSDALQARRDWLGAHWVRQDREEGGREVKLLDYACGTGAITKALGPYVTKIRGIDVSEGMIEKFNEAAKASGMSEEQAIAVVGDLLGETVPEHLKGPEFENFDVAAVGLGFHHFDDTARCLQRLKDTLKPATGILIIVDFLPFDHGDHHQHHHHHGSSNSARDKFPDMAHTIKHNGFDKPEMEKLFREAGLTDFKMDILDEPAVMELPSGIQERKIFIAKGRREAGGSEV